MIEILLLYITIIQGKNKKVLISRLYWLYVGETKYRFRIKICTRNDLEPEEEGVQGILLFPADEEINFKFGYRGIYIPDSFLEEHYPDKYKELKEKDETDDQ